MKKNHDYDKYIAEIKKCKESFLYFTSKILLSVSGTGAENYFIPYDAQLKFFDALETLWDEKEKSGIIFLASRQCGKTQLNELLCIWLMIFNINYPILYMTRDLKLGQAVIREMKEIIERLPSWLRPKYVPPTNTGMISFDNGSNLTLEASTKTSSKTSTKGRGNRPLLIWIDEAAFIPLEEHITALGMATARSFTDARKNNIPYGIILTSSPNGRKGTGKEFFDLWSIATRSLDTSGYYPVKIKWDEIPDYDESWFKKQCELVKNDQRRINQELNLVFLGSNENVFSDDTIIKLYSTPKKKPINEEVYIDGKITWWSIPDPNKKYIISLDTATANGSDKSIIQLFNFETLEQVAEGIFKTKIKTFVSVYVSRILSLISNCVIAIERTGVGNQTIEEFDTSQLQRFKSQIIKDYKPGVDDRENTTLGISTNRITRPLMLDALFAYLQDDDVINNIHSTYLREEIAGLKPSSKGKIEGTVSDDAAMAYMFILFVKEYYKNISNYFKNVNEEVEDSSEIYNAFETCMDSVVGDEDFLDIDDLSYSDIFSMGLEKYNHRGKE